MVARINPFEDRNVGSDMKRIFAIVLVALALLPGTASARQFIGGCFHMNAEQCANSIAPGIWENVGGSSPFWQSIASGIDETPPLPTPQERQQCVAACQTRHTQAITDCVAGLISLAEDPDEIDAEAAHSTCVSTMVGRFNECMANCWN